MKELVTNGHEADLDFAQNLLTENIYRLGTGLANMLEKLAATHG